ncbi:Bug family tripartite tricarboxylate transporter substrate binding protein [Neoroseomonas oryzicola]|uniref:Tripartite tricarboxylate transporter substrate binding protein n=1 Tax=Neoroseomonas oryzicola TaxID=535904 RepID=A0A9X9WPK7_9PROT|nr:tripartite tricarboxylate transporter substrate binding protein [Neoroseomonas oryzicola]MBR0662267.1 tripartite tricarboxylate transporter substrate binding protein [Neoroseomonas oryzicola]NKE19871.1 tripartite tricarboxylate transporter substrate binding protein [Neoroseomonas oryzicola]
MKITRRAALGTLLAAPALAQEWPTRPVRCIIPYPPGGPTDLVGRVIAQRAQQELGQPLVPENKPGASGTIGAAEVARAAPDGQVFLMNASIHVIIPHLNRNLPFDALNDFTPVTNMAMVPLVALVNPGLPVRSLRDLADYAKANPGRLSYGSSGNGAAQHLAGEMFKQIAGVDMTHVPYRGAGPAIQDLIAGNIQVMFDSVPAGAGAVRQGLLRPLAVTTPARIAAYPDLPTTAEAGFPGLVISTWYGIWAPPRMPMAIAERMQRAVAVAVQDSDVKARLATLGADPVADTPADFAAFCRSEYEKFGAIVRAANIRLD